MDSMINFGIDLGTTNSAIAKFVKGDVNVFTNPLDYGRSTLPSVVYYKKDRIIVGNKAKTYLEKDAKNVAGLFKRKMGTSESFNIKSLGESKTPTELSAQVLKELKTFVNTGEELDATVLTIPASFDMVQSNATKEAGYQAGFKQVVLLQEPIAASLAYANMKKENETTDGTWLVYDLGGGTFDVALVRIKDGEMKVVDHEGDNFLGGADFDKLIIDKIVIPKLKEEYSFDNLEDEMKSASGKHNAKYLELLNKAEEAKIRLSAVPSSEVVVERWEDDNGEEVDTEVIVSRSEFNSLIQEAVDSTIEMVKTILTRNNLSSNDIKFNLMVGGSTFIPYVRTRVEELLNIPANCEIDPTTAIAMGAAYFAATKPKELTSSESKQPSQTQIKIKASYSKTSKEKDELFAARVTGDLEGLNYKITRNDGGFDSGLKNLTERINEDLPLVENTFNFFTLTVYDAQNNVIETDLELIGINSGFGISGQPLPEDICLEVDDYDNPGNTKLELIFQRNTILPTKKTLTFPLNKNILKGSEDEVIWINVFEGDQAFLPEANKPIGVIRITGNQLSRDIAKGSDIELTFTMSESRDLTVSAYLNMSDQDFKEVFNPKTRETNVELLKSQVEELKAKLDKEIEDAEQKEDYEKAGALNNLRKEMDKVSGETGSLTSDDVSDDKYKLEDRKRKIAQGLDNATKDNRLNRVVEAYQEEKELCESIIDENGNDHERKAFNDIVSQEEAFLSTKSAIKINEKIDELFNIRSQIKWRTPSFLTGLFNHLKTQSVKMNDQTQAKSLIDGGNFAIESENWDRLRDINYGLLDLLPRDSRAQASNKIGFGL